MATHREYKETNHDPTETPHIARKKAPTKDKQQPMGKLPKREQFPENTQQKGKATKTLKSLRSQPINELNKRCSALFNA